ARCHFACRATTSAFFPYTTLFRSNFLQDDGGRWYAPDPNKAEDLERLRRRALLAEFETYLGGRGKLKQFRTEAVRAGFADAWRRDRKSTRLNSSHVKISYAVFSLK